MPGLGETLRFFIDLNADKAIAESKKFGASIEQETKKGESSIDSFSRNSAKFGAAAVGVGGAILYGLSKAVAAYSDAEEQHLKLTNAVENSSKKFSKNGQAVSDAAQHLQTYTTVEGDAAEAGAAMLVQFGLTEDQVISLTPLMGDLAMRTGKSMEQVGKAIGKAASGEGAGALTKMGVVIDDTAYKADAFGATMSGLSVVQGFAAEQAQTASGKMTMLKNNLQDIAEGVGGGAAEVLSAVVGPLSDIASHGGAASGALEGIGKAGAVIGGASVLVGGLALVASTATKVSTALHNAEGGLNAFGKAASGIGLAVGAFAAIEGTMAAINAGKGYADQTADAVNRMTVAIDKGKDSDAFSAFKDAVKAEQGTLRLSAAWESFGAKVQYANDNNHDAMVDGTADIENMQRALDDLDPKQAKVALDEMAKFTDTLDHNSDQYKTNKEWIDKNRKSLEDKTQASLAARAATNDMTVDEQSAADAAKAWSDSLKDTNGALGLFKYAADDAAAGVKGFSDAAEGLDTDEQVKSAVALGDALNGVRETVGSLPPTFDAATAASGGYNEEQTKAIDSVLKWGDATKAQISTLIASGATSETVAGQAAIYRDQLGQVMGQAGMTTEQIAEYQRVMGLTDEQVQTEIKLSGDAEAKFKLQFMQGQLDKLDQGAQAEILALINAGEYQKAQQMMADLTKARTIPVRVKWENDPYAASQLKNLGYTRSVPGGGGPAVVPLGVTPMATTPAVAVPATININVSAGIGDPAEIGRKVIDSIRAAERVQGKGWRVA